MSKTMRHTSKSTRNTQPPRPAHPSITRRPLGLPAEFPLFVRLHGTRDDEPVRAMHVHDVLEVGYRREGAGTFFVGPKVIPFAQGDITVITDLEIHRAQSAPGTSSSWAWFFFQPAALLGAACPGWYSYHAEDYAGERFRNVIKGATHPALTAAVKEMMREAEERGPAYEHSMRALVVVLLNRLHRTFGAKKRRRSAAAARDRARAGPGQDDMARLCPALDLVSRAYREPLPVGEMAEACHMSVRTFQLVFTRAMGCPPQEYVIRSRVRAAQALLASTDTRITRIAMDCGFGSLSSFNRAFRKVVGRTPREERAGR